MKIVFIGAGKLATHLAQALHAKSYNIVQVYSRTIQSAQSLANQVQALATNNTADLTTDAHLYIFSIKDAALKNILPSIPSNNGLWIHTAGSIPLNIFEEYSNRYAVLYPFQTFSEDRKIKFDDIPVFIEASNNEDLLTLDQLCKKISTKVYPISSDERKTIHLAGVFACNFVNHMYAIADKIVRNAGIPFDVLRPLIDETASKTHTLLPNQAQTGPAIRYDLNVINEHIALLEDQRLKDIYTLISKDIYQTYNKE
ncbi:MAG: hypothetical protein RL662_907 [Bacteroidota bacterium]|jgi:predicted short-subunit dehydrogenase-like oxidoreductase (DUF2520 family)